MSQKDYKIVLETQDVNVFYGEKKVLSNISLKIQSNTIVALIGPSGCGKSTFLRLFNRMNDYIDSFRREGKVFVNNKNIYDKHIQVETLRKNVGMVFQKPNPFPKSIYENIAYGLRIQGEKRKKELNRVIEKSLREAALWDEVKDNLKKNALELSGGQQQRLCIARTLALEPSVILMDEPSSALDPISTSRIEDLIYDLSKYYTILIVTHNMNQAKRVSHKTAFFYLGKLIEFNNTRELFHKPKEQRTEDYIRGNFG